MLTILRNIAKATIPFVINLILYFLPNLLRAGRWCICGVIIVGQNLNQTSLSGISAYRKTFDAQTNLTSSFATKYFQQYLSIQALMKGTIKTMITKKKEIPYIFM